MSNIGRISSLPSEGRGREFESRQSAIKLRT